MSCSEALPEGWEMVTLSDVGHFKSGSGFPLNAQGKTIGRYPFFKVSDFSNQGNERTLNRANHYIEESDRQRIGARVFQPGTIAFAKIGAAIFLERKRIIDQESCLDNNMAGYTLQSNRVSRDLVLANLQQFSLGSLVASTALPAIGSGELKGIAFPMPSSPDEQKAIAAALSDADGVVAGLERVITKKRLIKQGAMQDLLAARRRLPGFSGEWEVKRLGDHVRFLKNGTHSRAQLSVNGPVKNLHYGDIHGASSIYLKPAVDQMPTLDSASVGRLDRLAPGDVVFVDASEDLVGVGKAVEIAELGQSEVVSGLHTIAARFDKSVLVDGFKAFLQFMPAFRNHLCQLAAGTKVLATNRAHIASAEVPLPGLEEQRAIAGILADMDAEIQTLEARLTKARAVKEGMMQNLLTGRVRMV